MLARQRQLALVLLAVFAVPTGYAGTIFGAYAVSLRWGQLPFLGQREWIAYALLALHLAAGATMVYFAAQGRNAITGSVLYVALMAIGLATIHIQVACFMGDCI